VSLEVEEKAAARDGDRLRPEPRVEPLVFERSGEGKVGYSLPPLDVPEAVAIPKALLREEIAGETEMTEVEVARHFTRLSRLNFSIDQGLYPLGSCTMKHNPRLNEKMARLPGFAAVHPLAPEEASQGSLALAWQLERILAELTGLPRVTLQPSAGAQGELAGILMVRKALEMQQYRTDNRFLHEEVNSVPSFESLVGDSLAIEAVYDMKKAALQAAQVCSPDAADYLAGDTLVCSAVASLPPSVS
jgi:hypothetical protein